MNNQIGLGVQVIIKNDKGEILFEKRSKEFGFGEYELPGGHLEFGETFEQCVIRECREELGINIEIDKLISVATNMKKGNHYIIFSFLAKSYSGVIENKEPDIHSEIRWFPENKLPTNLFVASKNAFEDYFSGNVYNPNRK